MSAMFRVLAQLSLSCLVLEVYLLVRAWRAKAGRGEVIFAAVLPFALFAADLVVAGVARARTIPPRAVADNAERVRQTSAALTHQVEVLTWGTQLVLPVVLVAAAVIAVCAWRCGRASLRRCLATATFVVGGAIVPTGYALAHYTGLLSHTGANIAGIDPEMKTRLLSDGIEEAGLFLRHAMVVAAVLGSLVTIVLARTLRRPASGRAPLDAPRWLPPAALGAAIVLAGAGLYFRRELAAPWPEPSRNALFNVGLFEAATVAGPDEPPFAPILEVLAGGVRIDGASQGDGGDRAGLEALAVLRNNLHIMRPGEPFPGQLGVICSGDVPARRLDDLLQRAAVLGYVQPSLLLPRTVTIERPVLGRLERSRPTAVALHVASDEGQKGWFPVAPSGTCRGFTTAALAARRKSNYVQLALDWKPEAREFAPKVPELDMDKVLEILKSGRYDQ